MKKVVGFLMAFILLVSLIAACAPESAPAPAPTPTPKPVPTPTPKPTPTKVYNLRLSSYVPDPDVRNDAFRVFGDLMEKKSNGQLKLTVYPGGSLFKAKEDYDALSKGLVDFANFMALYFAGKMPLLGDMQLIPVFAPFYENLDVEWTKDFIEISDPELIPHGMKAVMITYTTGQTYWYREPVRVLEDMKGLKVRAVGTGMELGTELLGMEAMGMPISDAVSAAQKGIIDGACLSLDTGWGYGFQEFLPWITWPPVYSAMVHASISLKTWDKLSPDLQKIVVESANEAQAWLIDNFVTAVDKEFKIYRKSPGVTFYDVPEEESVRWRAATNSWWDKMGEKHGAVKVKPFKESIERLVK